MFLRVITHGDGANPIIQRTARIIGECADTAEFLYWDRDSMGSVAAELSDVYVPICLMTGGGKRNVRVAVLLPIFWLRLLFKLMTARNADVHYAHTFECALVCCVVRILRGVPYVYHIHDNIGISHHWWRLLAPLIDRVDGWVVKHAASVVVPDQSRVIGPLRPFASKISVVPNCTGAFDGGAVGRDHHDIDVVTVLAIGSLEEDRGIDLLLKSVEGLRSIRIVAAGRVAGDALRRSLSHSTEVEFLGSVPHSMIRSIYERGDIVFLFYRPDLDLNIRAAPMKFLEALAAGRPVLVNSEVKISSEVLQQGIGYVCRFDVMDLRSTLKRMATDRTGVLGMGQRAREVYERNYGFGKVENHLKEILAFASTAERT